MRSYLVTCTNLDLSFRALKPTYSGSCICSSLIDFVHVPIFYSGALIISCWKKPQQVPNNRKTWLCFKNLFSTFFKELTHINWGTLFENYSKSLIFTTLRAKRATFIFKENRQNRHLAEFHQHIFSSKKQKYVKKWNLYFWRENSNLSDMNQLFPFEKKWHWVLE